MSPANLRARAVDYFIEPRAPEPAPLHGPPGDDPAGSGSPRHRAPGFPIPVHGPPGDHPAPPSAPRRPPDEAVAAPVPLHGALSRFAAPRARQAAARAATRFPLRAAVLGAAADAAPVAGALANALRAAGGAPTAAVAVWSPGHGSAAPRRAPATVAALRLAARLTARGLPAAARGRLAWMRLDDHPVAAAVGARRAAGALEVPFVVVLAGPRCDVVEGLLAEQDLVVVVTAEPDGPLARLAIGGCAGAALACGPCGPGPGRWLALGGLAGARGLAAPVGGLVRDLAEPAAAPLEEVAW
jgi:hypothetical protein